MAALSGWLRGCPRGRGALENVQDPVGLDASSPEQPLGACIDPSANGRRRAAVPGVEIVDGLEQLQAQFIPGLIHRDSPG